MVLSDLALLKILSCQFVISGEKWRLRLVGDPLKKSVVEVYNGFTWGRICTGREIPVGGNLNWNLELATIVCRHLGYEKALAALKVPVASNQERRPKFWEMADLTDQCFPFQPDCNEGGSQIWEHCFCSAYDAGVICSMGRYMIISPKSSGKGAYLS